MTKCPVLHENPDFFFHPKLVYECLSSGRFVVKWKWIQYFAFTGLKKKNSMTKPAYTVHKEHQSMKRCKR